MCRLDEDAGPQGPGTRAALLVATLVAGFVASGCPEDRSAEVPLRPTRQATATLRASTAGAATPTFTATPGQELPQGTHDRIVEGAAIGFGGFELRALLSLDADHDGDRDAVVALASPTELAIGYARRDGARFSQSILGRSPLPAGCSVTHAGARTLAADLGVAQHELQCPEGPSAFLSPFVLGTIVTSPESVRITAPLADEPVVAHFTALPRAEDVDGDGASDLVLDLDAVPRETTVSGASHIVLRNLAGGMAPDASALIAEIGTLEQSSRRSLERSPSRALAQAAEAVALARALCPEAGNPLLTLGRSRIDCRLGGKLLRAQTTWIAALLRTHALEGAFARLDAMKPLGLALDADAIRVLVRAVDASRLATRPTFAQVAPNDAGVVEEPLLDVADGGAPGESPLRVGATLWLVRPDGPRIVRLPDGADAGVVGECVVSTDATRIACRTSAGVVAARLGSPR